MKLQRVFLICLALIINLGVFAQQTKVLNADKHNEYGLVYSLPITMLDIEVVAQRTILKAGPYNKYAKKYLGISNVIAEDSEAWEIKSVRVTPKGVADAETQYLMQLKPGALTFISLTEDGSLLAINKEVTLPSEEVTLPTEMLPSSLDNNEYLQYVNEDFLVSQSSAKRAQMLAESIMEVRNAKIALSRGTAEAMPTDGKQLEIMLASLAHQEQTMTDAFVGTEQTETVVRKFSFMPSAENNSQKQVLFRLSDFAGFVDADNYSGEPIYITINVTRRGEIPVNDKGEDKKMPKDAVVYTIPGTAMVKISTMTETLYQQEMEFSQFGINFGLNPAIFSSKKEPSYAVFDPATGAILDVGRVEVSQ